MNQTSIAFKLIVNGRRAYMSNQSVQTQYLLSKIKGLLETTERYFQARGGGTKPREKIKDALNAIEALPHQFDQN
jgi:hypothetical protein